MVEALACGVPVITTDHPDNQARLLVEHGVTGWLCAPAGRGPRGRDPCVSRSASVDLDPGRGDARPRATGIASSAASPASTSPGTVPVSWRARHDRNERSARRARPRPRDQRRGVHVPAGREARRLPRRARAPDDPRSRRGDRRRRRARRRDTAAVAPRHDVRLVRHPRNRGLAAARNTGIAAATAPVVAFTDDDCVPADDWLEALLEPYDSADVVAVGGGVEALRRETLDPPVPGRDEPAGPARDRARRQQLAGVPGEALPPAQPAGQRHASRDPVGVLARRRQHVVPARRAGRDRDVRRPDHLRRRRRGHLPAAARALHRRSLRLHVAGRDRARLRR